MQYFSWALQLSYTHLPACSLWLKYFKTEIDIVELLNPKQNKAKLLGWALLSRNPTSSMAVPVEVVYHQLAIYSRGQQKKFNYSAPIKDIELKFRG